MTNDVNGAPIKKNFWVRHGSGLAGFGPFRVADVKDDKILLDKGNGRGKWVNAAEWMVVSRTTGEVQA